MLSKLSNLNSNLALSLGYLNPALNNSALIMSQYSFDFVQELKQLASMLKTQQNDHPVKTIVSQLIIKRRTFRSLTQKATMGEKAVHSKMNP